MFFINPKDYSKVKTSFLDRNSKLNTWELYDQLYFELWKEIVDTKYEILEKTLDEIHVLRLEIKELKKRI